MAAARRHAVERARSFGQCRAISVGGGSVAHLTVLIVAPAVDRAARRETAGVEFARAHVLVGVLVGHKGGQMPFGHAAVAELAPVIPAPAPGLVVGCDTAGIPRAGHDAPEGMIAPYQARHQPYNDGAVPDL